MASFREAWRAFLRARYRSLEFKIPINPSDDWTIPIAWLEDLKSFDKKQASCANPATRNHISKIEGTELGKCLLNFQIGHPNYASKMTRDGKLPEILEVMNESGQFIFPNMDLSGMEPGTSKGKVLYTQYHWTIAILARMGKPAHLNCGLGDTPVSILADHGILAILLSTQAAK
jgi:hypothetical protein